MSQPTHPTDFLAAFPPAPLAAAEAAGGRSAADANAAAAAGGLAAADARAAAAAERTARGLPS